MLNKSLPYDICADIVYIIVTASYGILLYTSDDICIISENCKYFVLQSFATLPN